MSSEIVVGVRASPDLSSVDNAVNSMQSQIGKNFIDKSSSPSMISSASQQSNIENISSNNENLSKQNEVINSLNGSLVSFNEGLQKIINSMVEYNNKLKSDSVPGMVQKNKTNKRNEEINTGGLVKSIANIGLSMFNMMTSTVMNDLSQGHVIGGMQNTLKGLSVAATAVAGLATAAAGTSAALGSVSKVAGGIALAAGVGATALTVQKKSEEAYEEARPGIDKLLGNYGNWRHGGTSHGLSNLGAVYRYAAVGYNTDTGLSNEDFITNVNALSKYGYTDVTSAAGAARTAALWARRTGGDAASFTEKIGKLQRFGGDASADTVSYLFGASKASGMANGQFGEFLDSIERVIENGTAKGYTRSTKEVADTVTYFSKLSGGSEIWKGTNGANMINRAGEGIASTTGLSSSTDMISYRVHQALYGSDKEDEAKALLGDGRGNNNAYVEGGGAANILAAMEHGLRPENFKQLSTTISTMYQGDTFNQIAAWKQISGLNWTGANELYNLSQKSNVKDTDISETIKRLKDDPTMQTDTTKIYNAINKVERQLVTQGANIANETIRLTESVDGWLATILQSSLNKTMKNSIKLAFQDDMFTGKGEKAKDFRKIAEAKAESLRINSVDGGDTQDAIKFAEGMQHLDALFTNNPEARHLFDYFNMQGEDHLNMSKWEEMSVTDISQRIEDIITTLSSPEAINKLMEQERDALRGKDASSENQKALDKNLTAQGYSDIADYMWWDPKLHPEKGSSDYMKEKFAQFNKDFWFLPNAKDIDLTPEQLKVWNDFAYMQSGATVMDSTVWTKFESLLKELIQIKSNHFDESVTATRAGELIEAGNAYFTEL